MAKLPSFDPIEYLVRRKHPKAVSLIAARLNIGDADVPSYQEVLRHQKAADAFRNELSQKTPAEINELVKAEKEKQRAETVDRLAREEAQRFYNLPSATADFDYYCKAAYWRLDECVALSFGKDPKQVNWKTVQPFIGTSPFAREFEKLRDLTSRAKWAEQLFDPVRPPIYLAWAKQQKIGLSEELVTRAVDSGLSVESWLDLLNKQKVQSEALLKKHNKEVAELKEALREERTEIDTLRKQQAVNEATLQASESEKPLGTKERDSLLNLVGGMAVGWYGFDPHQSRNTATKEIWSDLQRLGISLHEDTVRKYLKEGAELIPRDALENLKRKPNSAKR